jgi:hypothetical protein
MGNNGKTIAMFDYRAGFEALPPLDKTAEDKRDPVHTWIHRN